jgi:hypothetical protein
VASRVPQDAPVGCLSAMMLGEMRRRWEARRIARIAEIDGHVFISNPPSSDTLARSIRRSRRSRGANPSRQRDRPLVGLNVSRAAPAMPESSSPGRRCLRIRPAITSAVACWAVRLVDAVHDLCRQAISLVINGIPADPEHLRGTWKVDPTGWADPDRTAPRSCPCRGRCRGDARCPAPPPGAPQRSGQARLVGFL